MGGYFLDYDEDTLYLEIVPKHQTGRSFIVD